jgi:hypothetical protein
MAFLDIREIRSRAVTFAVEWKDASNEQAEAQTFWNQFFDVFGISRKRLASFEQNVKLYKGKGRIDLFWKGCLLIEHKSRGKDLRKAYEQSLNYFEGLSEDELPRYVLVSDFARLRLYDLEEGTNIEFELKEFPEKIHHFDFMTGRQRVVYKDEDPANIEAAQLLGDLHEAIEASGYGGHDLERWMVRFLFCLFADDTGIFDKDIFTHYIERFTEESGVRMGSVIEEVFQVLNTPIELRSGLLSEELAAFPYVNGDLFAESLRFPSFNANMRKLLLKCCYFDWSKISPAIFGSLFQSVMNPMERRNLGAHYTSEKNILKAIHGLFMGELRAEFESCQRNVPKLQQFHEKFGKIKILDPACGCGNFLIIAYRELRRLEMEVLSKIWQLSGKIDVAGNAQGVLDITEISWLDVDQFYGIEIDEFAARIAQVALYMTDHQMNIEQSAMFGQSFLRLPLVKAPHIHHDNALRLDWASVVAPEKLTYIVGNPPFIGSKMMTVQNREDLQYAFTNGTAQTHKGVGVLDFVSAWYAKAAKYIRGTRIKVAFVSTNSISQGEQVGILWQFLLYYGVRIHFAHRTFKWSNEAKGNAAVYCVIIGFANYEAEKKIIFEYNNVKGEPKPRPATYINGNLVDAPDILIFKRTKPLCDVPEMHFGNMPLDGGHLLLTPNEKDELIALEPNVNKYIRRIVGSNELINNVERYCLWLVDCEMSELRKMPLVLKRVNSVREFRLASKAPSTQIHAKRPMQFRDLNQPNHDFIIVPKVSSENREIIPISIISKEIILSDLCFSVDSDDKYDFGVLTSLMHMAWTRAVCGRLKSDYRYSKDIVYNNFPWPEEPTEKQRERVVKAAEKVLEVRKNHPASSLADMYNPLLNPVDLVKAHRELDKAVDLCYRSQPFTDEMNRMAFLFELYRKYDNPLYRNEKQKKHRRK